MIGLINGTAGTANTWQLWNTGYTSGSITTAATTTSVWTGWNHIYVGAGTTSAITTNATGGSVWSNWIQIAGPTFHPHVQHVESPEERAQREARAEAARLESARLAAEAQAAEAKAKKLLMDCLTAAQQDTLDKHGYFDIGVGGKTYRIQKGWSHNVREVLPGGGLSRSFCAHPRESVPQYDNMLAQKLILEADEPTFLRMANRGN